jgi:hypothetical protein
MPVVSTGLDTVSYLMILMLAIGVLVWLVAGSVLVLVGRQVINRTHALAAVAKCHGTRPVTAAGTTAARWAIPTFGSAAVALLALASSLAVVQQAPLLRFGAQDQLTSVVSAAYRQIERMLPRQPVALSVADPDGHYRRRLTLGLAWMLSAGGYLPEISISYARELGDVYVFRGQPMPHVAIRVQTNGLSVAVTKGSVALADRSERETGGVMSSGSSSVFAAFRFSREVIAVAVRWYLRYGLSYRDVEELMAERGVTVDHVTIDRWVQRFTPEFIEAARPCRPGRISAGLRAGRGRPGHREPGARRSVRSRAHQQTEPPRRQRGVDRFRGRAIQRHDPAAAGPGPAVL